MKFEEFLKKINEESKEDTGYKIHSIFKIIELDKKLGIYAIKDCDIIDDCYSGKHLINTYLVPVSELNPILEKFIGNESVDLNVNAVYVADRERYDHTYNLDDSYSACIAKACYMDN